MNILVVFKKNFEEVHDEGLMAIKTVLQAVASTDHHVDYKPREHVRRADFIARDLVIVFGGDGTLTSLSHNIDAATPVMGVNSHPRIHDPEGSYGFYMDSSIDTFEDDPLEAREGATARDVTRKVRVARRCQQVPG